MDRVYLDHNATTPVDPRVARAMLPILEEGFGNPSSLHWYGQQARARVDEARQEVAALISASPNEIVFTGSGTEADNMALRGLAGASREPRRGLLVSALEHHALIHTGRALGEEGWPVRTLRALPDGTVDLDDLVAKVDDRTAAVAVMLANNETGVVQPMGEIVRHARERGALVHCDAVQAVGKIPVDVRALDVGTHPHTAHKFYGPKGVGVLYVKRGTRMTPLVRGGSQERNRRAGTENVAGVVGLGVAARLAREELQAESERLGGLRDALEERLLRIPGAERNGRGPRVPNTTNVSFSHAEAEGLLMALDLMGFAVSTGAACAAGAVEPSHVLKAMGLPLARVQGSLRFSLGRSSTLENVTRAAEAVAQVVERQRALTRTPAGRS